MGTMRALTMHRRDPIPGGSTSATHRVPPFLGGPVRASPAVFTNRTFARAITDRQNRGARWNGTCPPLPPIRGLKERSSGGDVSIAMTR